MRKIQGMKKPGGGEGLCAAKEWTARYAEDIVKTARSHRIAGE